MFARKGVPLIDGNNGGSGVEKMTVADLQEYAAFNRDFLDAVRAATKMGTSVEELAKSWKVSEKYVGYQTPQPARVKSNIEVIIAELK